MLRFSKWLINIVPLHVKLTGVEGWGVRKTGRRMINGVLEYEKKDTKKR